MNDERMANEVELASLDLRYQGFRLKAPALEERLLAAIAQRGIEEPLEGVDLPAAPEAAGAPPRRVLLNGFKRWRCARKLRLATVPYSSLGPDEAAGILSLLKSSNLTSSSGEQKPCKPPVLSFCRATRRRLAGWRRVSASRAFPVIH